MEYRFLGTSGLRVSELAMGAQTFGWGADRGAAHDLADRFFAAGGNMFDTSSTYNDGESESILGEWLQARGNRDSLVIASSRFATAAAVARATLSSVYAPTCGVAIVRGCRSSGPTSAAVSTVSVA